MNIYVPLLSRFDLQGTAGLKFAISLASCYALRNRLEDLVEISFDNPRTRDLLSCRQSIVSQFGNGLAKLICCRFALLRAAPSLAHVPTSYPVALIVSAKDGLCSVALGRDARLDFRPYAKKRARAEDLPAISEIEIIGVSMAADAEGRKT